MKLCSKFSEIWETSTTFLTHYICRRKIVSKILPEIYIKYNFSLSWLGFVGTPCISHCIMNIHIVWRVSLQIFSLWGISLQIFSVKLCTLNFSILLIISKILNSKLCQILSFAWVIPEFPIFLNYPNQFFKFLIFLTLLNYVLRN